MAGHGGILRTFTHSCMKLSPAFKFFFLCSASGAYSLRNSIVFTTLDLPLRQKLVVIGRAYHPMKRATFAENGIL